MGSDPETPISLNFKEYSLNHIRDPTLNSGICLNEGKISGDNAPEMSRNLTDLDLLRIRQGWRLSVEAFRFEGSVWS